MAIAGTLEIQMLADMARLKKDMEEGKRAVQRGSDAISNAARSARNALAALGIGIGAVVFVRLIRGALESQDALAKLSQKVNISVESLVGWQHAADLSGVSSEGLTKGIKSLTTQMFDAASGLKESQRNFAALDVQVQKTDGSLRNSDEVMIEIADKFSMMRDGAEKTALAVKLFGKAGLDMIPMLNQGGAALAAMREEGQKLNPVTTESAKQAELFNDSMNKLRKSAGTAGVALIVDLLPPLSQVADEMARAAVQGGILKGVLVGYGTLWKTIMFGTEPSTLEKQAEFIGELEKQMKMLQEEMSKPKNAFGIGGRPPEVLEREMRTLTVTLDSARQAMKLMQDQATRETGQRASAGSFQAGIPTTEEKDPIAEMIEKQTEAAEKQAATFRKQIALMDETTEVAKVLYDIEFGGLQLASQAAQDAVLNQAELLDQLNAQKKAQEDLFEFREMMNDMDQQQLSAISETNAITEAEKKLEKDKLDRLLQSIKTEQEIIREGFDEDMDFLMQQHEKKLIVEADFLEARLRLITTFEKERTAIEQRSATDREKFEKMSMRRKAETIFGELAALSSGVAQHSRKMFELNKIAGIAEAILSAHTGIARTLAAYPYPINIALAAAHGIAAFAQVQAIAGTQFGGGGVGSAPSLAGSTPATPVTPVGANDRDSGQTTIINFKGTTNERKLLRQFADSLNEQTHNGGRILVQ